MLQHAEEVYTPEVFSLFQKEYTVIGDYVAKKTSKFEMVYEYNVSFRGDAQEHLVKYDAANQTIHCSCMKFSFAGVLCRHALKVLDKKNIASVAAEHIKLTLCADEDAVELLKKLEEKKKELVRANKWMPHSSEDKLVEEDEDVQNVRGIKRKNPIERPKNQKDGPHSRFKGVLEKKNRGT
ncbi:hypothetical protein DY000_02053439 [Brassica cretica]|uniref:Protein FAR1-RELATED SEQUENCE n=1 Tax=Brassica cretica TaxID=69181 RepID=A0ABQ7A464_BRACR|nr:hypothetical protein DY000_02053439 [Brassica cretica]